MFLKMWFQRKSKNRAFTRRHVLDVKLRSDETRRARVRVTTLAVSVSLGTAFALYLVWRCGEWAVNALIYENRGFAIEQIDVQTDGVIGLDQLRNWAGAKVGNNLFALDLSRIKRDLELAPAVQMAAVERVLPHTLKIRVTEREPVAQIVVPSLRAGEKPLVYLLDAGGFVMHPLTPLQRSVPLQPGEQYPQITGVNTTELRPGRAVESAPLLAALRLITAFEHSPMAMLVDLHRIDVSSPEILQVTTGQQNEITLRTADLDRQLQRWRLVYEKGQQQARQIASLDLSVSDHVPLRWQDGVSASPVSPKPKKTSPYKKKHV